MWIAANGRSDDAKGVAFFGAWRATGLPVLIAVSKFFFSTTPHETIAAAIF
ncbi:MAG: hypothetical protein WA417_16020 [Stellaceae bacterium]|jgi:hypothetical protein